MISSPSDISTTNTTPYNLLTDKAQVDQTKLIAHNKAVILQALFEAKAKTAVLTYEGEGDNGSYVDTNVYPGTCQVLDKQVKTVKQINNFDNQAKVWTATLQENDIPLSQAIEDFTHDLIVQSGHQGYENNEGGGGTITFNTDSKEVVHDHHDNYDNIVEQEHSVCKY